MNTMVGSWRVMALEDDDGHLVILADRNDGTLPYDFDSDSVDYDQIRIKFTTPKLEQDLSRQKIEVTPCHIKTLTNNRRDCANHRRRGEMTHTPGPWDYRQLHIDGNIITKGDYWEIFTPKYDVAAFISRGAPIRKEADARLIAAAPELLDALRFLLAPYEGAWLGDDNDTADPDGSLHRSKSPLCGEVRFAQRAFARATDETR